MACCFDPTPYIYAKIGMLMGGHINLHKDKDMLMYICPHLQGLSHGQIYLGEHLHVQYHGHVLACLQTALSTYTHRHVLGHVCLQLNGHV
jgi:hypothetical protein